MKLSRADIRELARAVADELRSGGASPTGIGARVAPRPCQHGGFVYFMLCDGAAVKIGIAKDVAKRLHGIQCGNPKPVVLLAYYWVASPKDEEAGLHDRFVREHIRGEWFKRSAQLDELIEFVQNCALLQTPSAFDSLEDRLLESVGTDTAETP